MAKKLFQTLSIVSIALTSRLALAQTPPAAQPSPDPDANTRSAAQPGALPPIGPTDDQSPQPAAAPAQAEPASQPSEEEPPLDVKFELQSIREDHQGLQTD
jgi:hypothetical protein